MIASTSGTIRRVDGTSETRIAPRGQLPVVWRVNMLDPRNRKRPNNEKFSRCDNHARRQMHDERRAFAGRAVKRQMQTQRARESLADRQPQARAFLMLTLRVFDL